MGGLRLGYDLIKYFFPDSIIYTSNPTYPPHQGMAKLMGIKNKEYRYYDKENTKVNFKGMCEDFLNAKEGSFMLLQPCGHNPTGCDPSHEQ